MSNSDKAALVGAILENSGIHLWDKADSNFYPNGPNIQKCLHEVSDRNCQRVNVPHYLRTYDEKFFAMFNETMQQLKVDNSHKNTHSKEFMKWDN